MSDEEYFTVVFKGKIRDIKGNPLRFNTVFGEVDGVYAGNAFKRIDHLEQENIRLVNVLEEIMNTHEDPKQLAAQALDWVPGREENALNS